MTVTQPKPKDELREALGESRRTFFMVGVFSIFTNFLLLVSPIYMLQMYDRVLSSGNVDTLIALTVIALFLLGMMALIDILRQRLMVRVSERIDNRLGDRVFYCLFHSNLRRTRAKSLPLRDFETLRNFMTSPGLLSFFDVPWMPFYILLVYLFNTYLGIIATFGAVVIFILALSTELTSRRLLRESAGYSAVSSSFAETSLKNADALQAMGMLPNLQSKWRRFRDPAVNLAAHANERLGVLLGISKSFRFSLQVGILGAGAYLVLLQEITPGIMIAASIVMGRGLAPVEQAISGWRLFVQARGAYARLKAILAETPSRAEVIDLPEAQGYFAVKDLAGGPPEVRFPVVRGIQLQIEPGQLLGVIGPSASGKSTLGRLMVGVWTPITGSVRLDGAEMSQLSDKDRLRSVGYMPQEIELFAGTVAENISRFEKDFDPSQVIKAAQMADCHDMILRLPQGYLTEIGERGNRLSSGQRQRVGLARALYGQPSLLVLDEPNSNLDPLGNQALVKAVLASKQRKASQVIIAHNLDILFHADLVMVLREGLMEAIGPAREVLDKYVKRRAS